MESHTGAPPHGGPQTSAPPNPQGGPPSTRDSRRVLILGGTGFIGISTTLALLDAGYDVCLANRGRVYWNKDLRQLPGVEHIKADREDADGFAAALDAAAKSQSFDHKLKCEEYLKQFAAEAKRPVAPLTIRIAFGFTGGEKSSAVSLAVAPQGAAATTLPSKTAAAIAAVAVVVVAAAAVAEQLNCGVVSLQPRVSCSSGKLAFNDFAAAAAAGFAPFAAAAASAAAAAAADCWLLNGTVLERLQDEDGASQLLNFTFTGDVADVVSATAAAAAAATSAAAGVRILCHSPDCRCFIFLLRCMHASAAAVAACEESMTLVDILRLMHAEICSNVSSAKPLAFQREAIKQTCRWFNEACIKYPEQARAALTKLPKAIRLEGLKELRLDPSRSSSSNSSSSSSSSSNSDEGSSSDEDSGSS
ncbi:hypothetical protein Emag_007456 [Eimeria magna]